MKVIISEKSAVYAALAALSVSRQSSTRSERVARVINTLSTLKLGEMNILAARGAVCIHVDEDTFSAEISYAREAAARNERIDKLISLGAPSGMMRLFGISERKFAQKRSEFGIKDTNRNRPALPTEEETNTIYQKWTKLRKLNLLKDDIFLRIFEETQIELSKIWIVIRENSELQKH